MVNLYKDVFSITDVGLVRELNEDSCNTVETLNGYLCVVCDGMGGHNGGARASHIAVDCIVQFLSKEKYSNIRQALKEAIDFANFQIIGTASEHPELTGMGTTACVLLIQDDGIWIAHAGDSRIYLYESKGKRLHRLTKDHSYVQGLIDQGIISESEAENHPDKNRILKALGIKESVDAEVCTQPILPAKGDIFLICSDGLSGMVSDKQIEKILSDKLDLQEKETALMSLAKSAGGVDNITFQMVRISKSPHRKSVFESKNYVETKPKNDKPQWIKYISFLVVIIVSILVGVWIGDNLNNKPQLNSINPLTNDSILIQDSVSIKVESPLVEDENPDDKNCINDSVK